MKNNSKTILLVLSVTALASFGYYQHVQVINDLEEEIRTLLLSRDTEIESLAAQAAEKDAVIQQLAGSLAGLEEQIAVATNAPNIVDSVAQDNVTAGDSTGAGEALDIDALYRRLTTENKTELYERLNQEKQQRPESRLLTAQLALNAAYGDFINSLDLNENERIALTDRMKVYLAQQQDMTQQVASGEMTQAQFMQITRDYTMLDHLAGYLTDSELEQFQRYQETMAARQRNMQIDSLSRNMTSIVPGISEETSRKAAEIISQVMMSRPPADALQGVDAMISIYERAEEPLQQSLDEEEMIQVREFLEMQKQMMRNARF